MNLNDEEGFEVKMEEIVVSLEMFHPRRNQHGCETAHGK